MTPHDDAAARHTAAPIPCRACGYHAPADACPHCGFGGPAASVSAPGSKRRLSGPFTGIVDGAFALPAGLGLLFRTPGIKRWLAPPLLLTTLTMVLVLWWTFGAMSDAIDAALPTGIELEGHWAWIESLSESWGWLKATWMALVGAAEWVLNSGWALLTSQPLRWIGWFLLGSLAVWYCFSIAYEALAGPFLDEVQGRIEARWYGGDPRSNLERPNDIPVARCVALSSVTFAIGCATAWLLWPVLGVLAIAVALPLGFAAPVLFDRRFFGWARWVASVEGRAIWASLQATVLTALLLVLALPLYFVPVVGYFLFASATGFATALGLLDIPFERRGWTLRQRMRFVGRHILPFLVFGISAGFLLAIPIIGPVLMVPAASIGGLWLTARLDKGFLR